MLNHFVSCLPSLCDIMSLCTTLFATLFTRTTGVWRRATAIGSHRTRPQLPLGSSSMVRWRGKIKATSLWYVPFYLLLLRERIREYLKELALSRYFTTMNPFPHLLFTRNYRGFLFLSRSLARRAFIVNSWVSNVERHIGSLRKRFFFATSSSFSFEQLLGLINSGDCRVS